VPSTERGVATEQVPSVMIKAARALSVVAACIPSAPTRIRCRATVSAEAMTTRLASSYHPSR